MVWMVWHSGYSKLCASRGSGYGHEEGSQSGKLSFKKKEHSV